MTSAINASALLDANKYFIRESPFYRGTQEAGCRSYDHINGMFVAIDYGHNPRNEFEAITQRVALYDTAIQRQIEVKGADALRFSDYLFTRDLRTLEVNRARYGFFCRPDGVIITDAVVARIAEDTIWFSPTVADVMLWAQGIAAAGGYGVEINEAEYAVVRLEGRLSPDLMLELVGDGIKSLPYYQCGPARIAGVDVLISKTAAGPVPGCDVYVPNIGAMVVWDAVVEAGERYGLLVKGWGEVDHSTMMESGVLFFSYTTNYEDRINPLEFWKSFVDLDGSDFIGRSALQKIRAEGGPRRKIVGLLGSDRELSPTLGKWEVRDGASVVGFTRWVAASPTLWRNVAYGLLDAAYADRKGKALSVLHSCGEELMTIADLPFVPPQRGA